MAIIQLPNNQLPAIVTYLEMLEKPKIDACDSPFVIERWEDPDPKDYLSLFRAIGEEWLWLSRLLMDAEMLRETIVNQYTQLYLVKHDQKNIGLIELDFSKPEQCEIVFFGLTPDMAGKGNGRWLMAQALQRAWQDGIKRVWLHTCSLDAPHALAFYQKSGFRAYKREIETMDDPRITGHIRKNAAAHVPLLS